MTLIDNTTSEKIYTFKTGNIILIANSLKELDYYISFTFGRNSKKYQQYQEAVTYYNNHNWYGGFCSDLYYLGFFVNPSEETREVLKREYLTKEGLYNAKSKQTHRIKNSTRQRIMGRICSRK